MALPRLWALVSGGPAHMLTPCYDLLDVLVVAGFAMVGTFGASMVLARYLVREAARENANFLTRTALKDRQCH